MNHICCHWCESQTAACQQYIYVRTVTCAATTTLLAGLHAAQGVNRSNEGTPDVHPQNLMCIFLTKCANGV